MTDVDAGLYENSLRLSASPKSTSLNEGGKAQTPL